MTATETKWTERVRDWRASGLTAEQFAEGKAYKATTLRVWSSRVRGGDRAAGVAPGLQTIRMVRVRRAVPVPDEESGEGSVWVAVGGVRVHVRAGFDGAMLREVVRALRGER